MGLFKMALGMQIIIAQVFDGGETPHAYRFVSGGCGGDGSDAYWHTDAGNANAHT